MKKEELKKGALYVHTNLNDRRTDALKFVEIEERNGFWVGVFTWSNGSHLLIADWAVEKYVCEFNRIQK
ncbi:MAG: hypothetical protein LBE04_03550 [Prevotellaceae bacterium]|jgi:hypothetical protein|nr:hypothetical protein [Prevotellaceae bacterium]